MDIIREGLINRMSSESSYSNFLEECAPLNCTYSYNGREDLIILITSVIGIAKGLSVALQLFTPLLFHMFYYGQFNIFKVKSIIIIFHFNSIFPSNIGRSHIIHLIQKFPKKLVQLDFFFNRHKSSVHTIQTERYTTRLYIILWLYNLFAENTKTIEILHPTESIFADLYSLHYTSLRCPCTMDDFPSTSYVILTVKLHQVCSSLFIQDAWIENIFDQGN